MGLQRVGHNWVTNTANSMALGWVSETEQLSTSICESDEELSNKELSSEKQKQFCNDYINLD